MAISTGNSTINVSRGDSATIFQPVSATAMVTLTTCSPPNPTSVRTHEMSLAARLTMSPRRWPA